MRYFADYIRDTVYAVEANGSGQKKQYIQKSLRPLDFEIKVEGCYRSEQPWLSEENGVGFFVDEITEAEYNTFGSEWIFDPHGGAKASITSVLESLK